MVYKRGYTMGTVNSKDKTPIVFDQTGQGPAIILVAGAMATRLAETSLAAALSTQLTVFALSLIHI